MPLALALAIMLLVLGWTLPLLETRTLVFWRDEFSILGNIRALWRDDDRLAAGLMLGASIIYPAGKALMLLWFLVMPFPARMRGRMLRLLRFTERWAFVDVIVIALIILASLALGPVKSTPQPGLYAFAGGILMLSITAFLLERAARRG